MTETVPTGWGLLSTNGPGCTAVIRGVSVTPAAGQTVTCLFVNGMVPPGTTSGGGGSTTTTTTTTTPTIQPLSGATTTTK